MTHHSRKLKNKIYILLAGILWGSMGLFVRGLNSDNLESLEIVEIRVLISTILMGLFLLIYDKSLFKIKLKDIWCFIGTGVFSITFFNLCYFQTILMTSMSVAAILLYTAPIIVVILSAIFFSEKITGSKIVAMILAFIGCFFVTGIVSGILNGSLTGALPFKGILLGLGSGLGYALYSIFGRFAIEKGYKSMTISFYTFLFSLLITVIIKPPVQMIHKIVTGNTGKDVLLSIGIALVATVLPYILYTYGLTKVENGKASIMASIEPVTATILGMLVFHEHITWDGALGIVMVLLAIVILNKKIVPKKEQYK